MDQKRCKTFIDNKLLTHEVSKLNLYPSQLRMVDVDDDRDIDIMLMKEDSKIPVTGKRHRLIRFSGAYTENNGGPIDLPLNFHPFVTRAPLVYTPIGVG